MKMNKKQQFMQAVRILAPDDRTTQEAAQRVREESLPEFPGGAALQFVVTVQKSREPVEGVSIAVKPGPVQSSCNHTSLPISHALRIKSAEFWLKLGEADQALRELEALPKNTWNHPAAVKTRMAAMAVLKGQLRIPVIA